MEIFTHKKFQAAIVASLAALLGILGPAIAKSSTFVIALGSITPVEWGLIIGPILTAIGAQGIADSGKEAALIKAAADKQANATGSLRTPSIHIPDEAGEQIKE